MSSSTIRQGVGVELVSVTLIHVVSSELWTVKEKATSQHAFLVMYEVKGPGRC